MNKSQNHYGGGGSYNKFGMGGGDPCSRDDGRLLVWEATRMLQEGFLTHGAEVPRLLELAHNLSQYLESTRTQYNRAISERDAAHRRLQDANNKLSLVENLVKRYAVVREPVIASDGYTYERESITKYLAECSSGNSKAYSQQTKEELTEVTVPNRSLHRLVTHLKEVRSLEVPPTTHRGPITALPSAMPPRAIWADDETGGNANMGPMPIQHLDPGMGPPASLGAGAAVGGGGITVPAPASASNNAGGGRFDAAKMRAAATAGNHPALHPCLRVYGLCNFMDDCSFSNYPYEACLNHIKGKCRYGQNCKELHVDPRDPRYQYRRGTANHQPHPNSNSQAHPQNAAPNAEAGTKAEDKATEKPAASDAEDRRTDKLAEPAAAAGKKNETSDVKEARNEAAKAEEAAAEAAPVETKTSAEAEADKAK